MMCSAGNGMEMLGQYPITLVTAYFEVGLKPGYSENPYPGWIRNFLPYVSWPLVIFCDEQSLDMLKEARGDKPAVYRVTRLKDFLVYKYWRLIKNMEWADGRHTAERGLVWHEKHNFLRCALSENPFQSEMFYWCDIGLFRYRRDCPWWAADRTQFRLFEGVEWPNFRVCRAFPQDKVIVQRNAPLSSERPSLVAGFFGGAIDPVQRWCDAYYQRLDERMRNGVDNWSEESVMQAVYVRRPQLAHALPCDTDIIPWMAIREGHKNPLKAYFLSGRRFPWKYFWRRLFSRAV